VSHRYECFVTNIKINTSNAIAKKKSVVPNGRAIYRFSTRLDSRFLENVWSKNGAVSHPKQTRNSPEKGTRPSFRSRWDPKADTARGYRFSVGALRTQKSSQIYTVAPVPGADCATAEQVRSLRQ